jgi:hypothetical protein
MDKEELIARLGRQRQQLEQRLADQIVQIENIDASIQVIEGKQISQPTFPPQNPFEGVPIPRISSDTYINIARRLIDNRHNIRVPGVRGEPLVKELNHRIWEVEDIIKRLDDILEQQLMSRGVQETRNKQTNSWITRFISSAPSTLLSPAG